MKISFSAPSLPRSGPVVVGVLSGGKLLATAERLDKAADGALSRAMDASRFKGESGQSLTVMAPAGVGASRVVLMGLGEAERFDDLAAQAYGGRAYKAVAGTGDKSAVIAIDPVSGAKIKTSGVSANAAYGALLASYRFDKYRTKEKADAKPSIRTLILSSRDSADAKKAFAPLAKIADGVFFTRDLVSEPANILYPVTLAAQAKTLEKLGVKIQVLDEKQMAKLGMGALLGVAQGSAQKPRLVVMRWDGAPKAKNKAPIAFVGKGVTFDTGGISIKPAGGMEDMKWDMGGAATVTGLLETVALSKLKFNVIGVLEIGRAHV